MKIAEIELVLTLFLGSCLRANGNFFMATAQMDELIATYGTFTENLEKYLIKQLEILNMAENYYNQLSQTNVTMEHLDNPIDTFSLIRRLSVDLDRLEKYTDINPEFDDLLGNTRYPDKIDLYGSAVGLKRIQDIYHLKFDDIVNGKLPGNITTFPMEASECFFMGTYMYLRRDVTKTIDWFEMALQKHDEKDESYFFRIFTVYELLAESYFNVGNYEKAINYARKVLPYLEDSRDRQRLKNSIEFYEEHQMQHEIGEAYYKVAKKKPKKSTMDIEHLQDHELVKHYSKLSDNSKLCYLCRNKVILSDDVRKRLKCLYLTETHPFLKLAPLKMEQIYINPNITMVHDVIHDKEIDYIIKKAKIKFKHIRTINATNYKKADYVLKTTPLQDEESDIVKRVSQRMAQFTSLRNPSVGPLQVSNYGVGGYYDPHYDCYSEELGPAKRNRSLTVIFYLSDVIMGGLTVFPELGLSVSPKRGSAIFWSNINSSGVTDPATSHGSCPVLFGHKWEANKWIYQDGRPMEHQESAAQNITQPIIV